jgi:hypothetical protein
MKTSHSAITLPLSLRDRAGNPLEISNVDLSWDQEDGDVMSCQMTFEIDFKTYQSASHKEMFNHEVELRIDDFGEEFRSDRPVELEIILDDECLDDLLAHANNVEEAAKYLLAQDLAKSPLLETENWYLLYAKQSVDLPEELDEDGSTMKIVYRTHWAAEEGDDEDELETHELFDQLVDFFDAEEWEYELLEDHGLIKLAYKGLSCEWECFARGNDLDTEIGFYSIYPENVPESALTTISEFLTRVNYGLPVGNFEMDLDSGEVRFKFALVLGSLIFAPEMLSTNIELNVMLADRFFPLIKSLANGEITVMQAIAVAENLNLEAE